MGYKYYDIHEQKIRPEDLQNKNAWCEKGARYEKSFVQIYGEALGLTQNPEKQTNDFAPDLINTKQGGLADLKTQRTPFFCLKYYIR
ncbi:hypothetical protein H8S90_13810 [Olivibacter sp. SDN3]|uniref:hypothetical protein n=1 Tax=Olivibacter sp. SDN3 TaxID=2764720 RepID=UPI0016510A86|nr:hypothetical protein [Olivibacter sp. SDN3]QNL47894.1 hypothetical protein H8S90_13810 [Olivibacter sp. SDN3]